VHSKNESEEFQHNNTPELRSSGGKLLHFPTRAARLQSSRSLASTHLQRTSRASDLHTSIPPCVLHVPTPAARLQRISRTLEANVPTPAARLYRISRTLEANSYTSLHLRHAGSESPELHTSTRPTRPCSTPASHLQNSVPLHVRHVPTPAARLQRISRTSYLYTSLHPLYACIASPELLRQTPTRPYTRTPASHFQTSRALEAYFYTYLHRL